MKRYPLISIALRYGAVAGILTFVLMVGLFYMGRHPLLISPFLDFRVLLFGVFIFFSLKEFRDDVQKGELYFWQGMMGSFMLVMVASAISSIGVQIFGLFESK